MQAVATGDRAAFRELSGRWERPLYRFLARQVGGEAEDLMQETWLRVVRAAPRFDARRRFSTWLFQIALNLCRDHGRRRVPAALDPGEIAAAVEDSGSPMRPARLDAALDARRLLETLPEAQREVVLLRLVEDLSERETAEVLGCPPGTVKSRLHHALARLSRLVRGEGEAPATEGSS